jgi:D-glycero-D-manno-heptose 1,7-bisphosphate phosphatase
MRAVRKKYQVTQAVILCGGFGTRLGKITSRTPKPLLKFNKIPFLDYLIQNLSRYNIKEIILLCHYKYSLFIRKYHNRVISGVLIKCIFEKKPLGTFGAIKNAKKKLKDYFLLLNGDTYFDINLRDLITSYNYKKYFGIVALANKKNNRFSKIVLSRKGFIRKFYNNKKSSLINSGSYVFSKKICNIESLKFSSLERDILPNLVKKNFLQGKKYVAKHNKFIDIGVQQDYKKAEKFLQKVKLKKAVFFDRDGVLNKDFGYVHKINNFVWKKDVIKAIKFLNDNNFYVFVVTNQSGVGRGYYSEKDVIKLHNWINFKLNLQGAHIDDFFYSIYYFKSKNKYILNQKELRKPNIGMIKLANLKWNISSKNSIVIGDQFTDIMMAKKANLKSYLLKKEDNLNKIINKFYYNKI